MDVVVAIMAGGAGTRLWPASTNTRPKQFLALAGERTLLQQSYDRARAVVGAGQVLVVTAAPFVGLVREQLPDLAAENVVGEPERKDTAAAAVLATLLAEKRRPGCTVVLLTSDHVITPVEEFARTVRAAVDAAAAGDALVTIGIPPTYAATGFGYLETAPGGAVVDVTRFVEKPNAETAAAYLASGKFLWNAGMFVWRAQAALAEMRAHLPAHVEALAAAVDGKVALAEAFAKLARISIDYGLMEKAARVKCAKATFQWADVGSFPAAAPFLDRDAGAGTREGNAHRGRVQAKDAHGNVVWCADPNELVALVGVDDLIVVRAGKRTLVAHKSKAEEIKKLVDSLASEDKE